MCCIRAISDWGAPLMCKILDFVRKESRVVITLDSDFHTILAVTNASAPSVVRIRLEGLKGPDLAFLIRRIWPIIEPHLQRGAMVSVNEAGVRIKKIPVIAPSKTSRS